MVVAAAEEIAPYVRSGNIVILESTSPVGTTKLVEEVLRSAGVDTDRVSIAYCPERVMPGNIMRELVENDRLVGGITRQASERIASFYRSFVKGEVIETSAPVAEMCKLTENAYRDVNIAFANELSLICEDNDIDSLEVIRLANRHPRVDILEPGAGVGGHCIAVDPWFIVSQNPSLSGLIRTAREVNLRKTRWVTQQIRSQVLSRRGVALQSTAIVVLGLAFKPNIDDLRESPALEITLDLMKDGLEVMAVEPNLDDHETINLISLDDALKLEALFVVLVKHNEFMTERVRERLKAADCFDVCGALAH